MEEFELDEANLVRSPMEIGASQWDEAAQSIGAAAYVVEDIGRSNLAADQTVITTLAEALASVHVFLSRPQMWDQSTANTLDHLVSSTLAGHPEILDVPVAIAETLRTDDFAPDEEWLFEAADQMVKVLRVGETGMVNRYGQFSELPDSIRKVIENWPERAIFRRWDYYVPIRLEHRKQEAEAREAALAKERDLEALMKAQRELSTEFDAIARREARMADVFRILVFLTIGLIGVLGSLSAGSSQSLETRIGQSLAVSIPLFVLAGYLAREGGQHRRVGRWAKVLAVQLKTVGNYVAPLSESDRSELLREFGSRVLGALPDVSGKGGDGEDLTTALTIIERLAGRQTRGPDAT